MLRKTLVLHFEIMLEPKSKSYVLTVPGRAVRLDTDEAEAERIYTAVRDRILAATDAIVLEECSK